MVLPGDFQDSAWCSASIQKFANWAGSPAGAMVMLVALPEVETAFSAAHVFSPIFAAPTAEHFVYLAKSIL